MVKIYVSPSCQSCRKVLKWFDEQKIPYESKNIFSNKLLEKDIKEIIQKTENGTDDIISPRSKLVVDNNLNFDDMKLSELIKFIIANPSILRRPIIVDDKRLQVGYNSEEIRAFLPTARKFADLLCTPEKCEKWGSCEFSKNNYPK